jgi:hypothetical protein
VGNRYQNKKLTPSQIRYIQTSISSLNNGKLLLCDIIIALIASILLSVIYKLFTTSSIGESLLWGGIIFIVFIASTLPLKIIRNISDKRALKEILTRGICDYFTFELDSVYLVYSFDNSPKGVFMRLKGLNKWVYWQCDQFYEDYNSSIALRMLQSNKSCMHSSIKNFDDVIIPAISVKMKVGDLEQNQVYIFNGNDIAKIAKIDKRNFEKISEAQVLIKNLSGNLL